jgi:hypothetical protein
MPHVTSGVVAFAGAGAGAADPDPEDDALGEAVGEVVAANAEELAPRTALSSAGTRIAPSR